MAQTLASISALLISVAFLVLGHGLQSTLLPLVAEKANFGNMAIGAISSAYYIGMVLGCLGSPHVIMRAGHIRAFAALVSLMSAAAILHPIMTDPVSWFVIRAISGFCLAGFYMIVESWLNESATNETRGSVMSIYVVVLFAFMMVGQVSISVMDIGSFVPFAIASVTVSLAVIPVALTTANQPAPITLVRFQPIKLYQNSPAALVGALLIGVANGALWSLSPLYGSLIGLSNNQSAFYAAAIIAGGVLSQWPVGRLSDRVDRRLVMMILAISTTVVALGIAIIAPQDFGLAVAFAVLIGICSQPGYAIAVSHAFDYADPEDFVETSSGLLLAFGIGSVGGPFIASLLMGPAGPSGLFYLVAMVNVTLVAFLVTRIFARPAISQEDKMDFEYAATAQVGSVISPEPLDLDAPNVIPPEEFPAYEDEIYSADVDVVTEEVLPSESSGAPEPDGDDTAEASGESGVSGTKTEV